MALYNIVVVAGVVVLVFIEIALKQYAVYLKQKNPRMCLYCAARAKEKEDLEKSEGTSTVNGMRAPGFNEV